MNPSYILPIFVPISALSADDVTVHENRTNQSLVSCVFSSHGFMSLAGSASCTTYAEYSMLQTAEDLQKIRVQQQQQQFR